MAASNIFSGFGFLTAGFAFIYLIIALVFSIALFILILKAIEALNIYIKKNR